LESVLAGSNGNGGIQLPPDSGGASSSAGERLAVATAMWHRLWTAMGSRFTTFVHFVYSAFLYRILIRLYSAFLLYIWPHKIVCIRPEKSAYFS
jgi:hypothetical protein